MRPYHFFQTSSFRRKKRQLNHLLHRLEQWQRSGKWSQMPIATQKRLTRRLQHLLRTLPQHLIPAKYRRILAGIALCLAPFSESMGQSTPSFLPLVRNPFSLTPYPSDAYAPQVVDIDGDGDPDVITMENNGDVKFFANTGSATNPSFATPVINPFGLPNLDNTATIDFADLDGDGDFDVLAGGYVGQFDYYENSGTPTNPQFGPVLPGPFGLDTLTFLTLPNFADFDGDGDQDLLLIDRSNDWVYLENTGTATNPLFAPPVNNPFGLVTGSPTYYDIICLGDLDNDGDVDVLAATYPGPYRYYENTGTPNSPAFTSPVIDPFGIQSTTSITLPVLADLDGDSDLDLLAFEYNSPDWLYYENDALVAVQPSDLPDLQFEVYPNPSTGSVKVKWETSAMDRLEKLRLYDLQGRLLIQASLPPGLQGNYQLELESLPAGTYLLEVQSESGEVKRTSLNKL